MEEKQQSFRLKLNLFDAIILIAVLCVGAFLVWNAVKPDGEAETQTTATVQYTIRCKKLIAGTGDLIQPGDTLKDTIKNYELGTVVSTEVVPSENQELDHVNHKYVMTVFDGYEDVLVTVSAPCTQTEEEVILNGEYTLRVGKTVSLAGNGYMSSGPIISIEREGQA